MQEWQGIRRQYRQHAARDHEGVLELLIDRLRDYDATVQRVSRDEVSAVAARLAAARGIRRMVVPEGLDPALLPAGLACETDRGLSAEELDGLDGVMTGCTLAIAETGTIVLQRVAGQGRRAISLVPDYHLCVVDEARVVETVPEAMARLQPTAALATTFFSGPSATADIEMTRIKGVHGPRFLDVLLVRDGERL
ncbi:MAG: LUD domain-containing protein [Acidobacteriota bacterium]|nr:LUD domain-containing protein [Acidobacteriota bacterium]